MSKLDDILSAVGAERTQIASVAVLIASLRSQVANALAGEQLSPAAQAKIDGMFADLTAASKLLTDAINFVPTPISKGSPVTGIANITPHPDPYINAMFTGVRWAAAGQTPGTPIEITVSFPQSASLYVGVFGSPYAEAQNGFRAVNPVQQDQIMAALADFSAHVNINFRKIEETTSQSARIRYAYSAAPQTAWCYFPSTSPEGGDCWFGTAHGWYENFVRGTYAYVSCIHETGHGLGLKHPHDVSGAFGAMPVDRDCLCGTIMSYRSYLGASVSGGYTNEPVGYPQTPMMYDYAALTYMYGSRPNAARHRMWSPLTGEQTIDGKPQGVPAGNRVFMCVADADNNDVLDVSNYPGAAPISRVQGAWSALADSQRAILGGGQIASGCVSMAVKP